MKGDRGAVRADLARLGPTLFVQEYRRRGWGEGEMAGVMAGAGVSAGKIHEVLSQGRERIDLAHLGPMNFVQEYRRRGWRDGDLAGIMAGEGVSAGKVHQALSQPKQESTSSRVWRAIEKTSDRVTRVAQDVPKVGTPASPLRANSKGERRKPDYGRVVLQQEAEEQRVRYLPPEEREAVLQQWIEEGVRQPKAPEGRRPSAAELAGAAVEQAGWGALEGGAESGYDKMTAMNSLRAPAVRQEIRHLEQFPAGSPERQRVEVLKQDLPEASAAAKEDAVSGMERAAKSRMPEDWALGENRLRLEMVRDLVRRFVAPMVLGKLAAGPPAPDKLIGKEVEERLLKAPWMQSTLKEAVKRGGPGADRALASGLASAITSLPKPVLAGEDDLQKLAAIAVTKGLKGARSGYTASRQEGDRDRAAAKREARR